MSGDTAPEPAELWTGELDGPAGRSRRGDDPFDPAGTFRAAVAMVIALEQRLSVDEFARTSVLTNMTAFLCQWAPTHQAPGFGG